MTFHLHVSRSPVDRWGTTDDLATSSPHSSRLSAFLIAAPSVKPVHSGMLFSHLFFCQPCLPPPWTVPCMIVLASPDDLDMCPYHLSLRCLTVVKHSTGVPQDIRFGITLIKVFIYLKIIICWTFIKGRRAIIGLV